MQEIKIGQRWLRKTNTCLMIIEVTDDQCSNKNYKGEVIQIIGDSSCEKLNHVYSFMFADWPGIEYTYLKGQDKP